MKAGIVIAFLFLLALPQLALVCNETISRGMVVPSINDEGRGQMVRIEMTVRGGEGTTYVSTDPIVGSLTQDSGQAATRVATELAGYDRNTCDVLLRIGENELSNIDGPSAGAAITLLLLSALENKTLRDDFTITGTIEYNGAIGPVGGIPVKAQAAADAGIGIMIAPYMGPDEMVMLDALANKTNITIVQVGDIKQALDIAFSRNTTGFAEPLLGIQELPAVPATTTDKRLEPFREIAADIINLARSDSLGVSDNRGYRDYFNNQLDIAEHAFENGYVYTGANTAFITWINLEFLKSSGAERTEVEERMVAIDSCYKRALNSDMTKDNWEWVVGGQLRASWAKKRISGVNENSFQERIGTLGVLRDVIYAEKWCTASQELIGIGGGGEALDKDVFKEIAVETIDAAEGYLAGRKEEFPDQVWHLEAAKQEFEDGLYGASVYDATYALYMTKGYDDVAAGLDSSEFMKNASAMEYTSIWARLYDGQARYIQSTEGAGLAPVQLSEFSQGLENRTVTMKEALGETRDDTAVELASVLVLALVLVCLAAWLYVTRSAG